MNKKEKIVLGDGKEYSLTEYDIGDFITIEEKFGTVAMTQGNMKQMMYWLHIALGKEHPMTIEDMYKLIPASFVSDKGVEKVFQALSKLNGWDTVDQKNEVSLVEKK